MSRNASACRTAMPCNSSRISAGQTSAAVKEGSGIAAPFRPTDDRAAGAGIVSMPVDKLVAPRAGGQAVGERVRVPLALCQLVGVDRGPDLAPGAPYLASAA